MRFALSGATGLFAGAGEEESHEEVLEMGDE